MPWGQAEFTRLSQNAAKLADFGRGAPIAFGDLQLNDAAGQPDR